MNKKLFNVLLFTAGAATGSAVTWYVVKTKYERILQEEIASVKETWAYMSQKESDEEFDDVNEYSETVYDEEECVDECVDEIEFDENDMIDYSQIASKYKTSGESTEDGGEGGVGDEEVPYINGPVVILPEDFGNGDYNHDLYCLTYYSDGVLANDWWEVIDIDETIGRESLEHFGDYAADMLYVRNERTQTDYEIARDDRSYADMVKNDPLKSVDED